MRRLISTGDAEQDAKLVSEELDKLGLAKNVRTREEDEEAARKANSGEFNGNDLVNKPHSEGETLMVLPDEKTEDTQALAKGDETAMADGHLDTIKGEHQTTTRKERAEKSEAER